MKADVIVVGGSYAGMAAALQLARARQQVVVIDAGQRRNRFVDTSHGFLSQDGKPPGEIAREAREQLLAYPTVRWVDGIATFAHGQADAFSVQVAGDTLQARRVVLATGVVDELPAIDGLAERWGKAVFHCPYCHGYELDQGDIGVIARGPQALHHALMLPDWGRVTLFLNGAWTPDDSQAAALAARGVTVEATPIARLAEHATVQLTDGRRLAMAGLFTHPVTRLASPLAEQLGCALEDGPAGPFIRRDAMMETTVPGVFACGDAARPFGNVAIAVGDGTMTGASTHRSLILGL